VHTQDKDASFGKPILADLSMEAKTNMPISFLAINRFSGR
jgi:hypothetical protein